MEVLKFKKEKHDPDKIGFAIYVFLIVLIAMIIITIRGDFKTGSIEKYFLIGTTLLIGIIILGLLVHFGSISSHPNESFRVKKGFEPNLILFSHGIHDSNLAIDKTESEICISQKTAEGTYDVFYFGVHDVTSEIFLEEESAKTIKEVDWDTKGIGFFIAGPLGYALANTLGRKKTRIIPATVKKFFLRISQNNDPKTIFEFKILNSFTGYEKNKLGNNENYRKALKIHTIIMGSDASSVEKCKSDIPMNEQEVYSPETILSKYGALKERNNIFFAPNIPSELSKNAIEAYAPNITSKDVLVLIDDTTEHSAKAGTLITNTHIYIQSLGEKPIVVCLSDITSVEYKGYCFFFRHRISINRNRDLKLLAITKDHALLLTKMLQDLSPSIDRKTVLKVSENKLRHESKTYQGAWIKSFGILNVCIAGPMAVLLAIWCIYFYSFYWNLAPCLLLILLAYLFFAQGILGIKSSKMEDGTVIVLIFFLSVVLLWGTWAYFDIRLWLN